MGGILNWYQQLPYYIKPIAFQIGFFSVRWYSLMYLAAFATVYLLLIFRLKHKEGSYSESLISSFLIYAIIGLLVGARIGYVLFYNFPYYLSHPLEIILPVSVTNYGIRVTGIYGMSYFGGLIGIILAGYIFSKKQKQNFWKLADFVIPAIPAGYFFGRIGNFLNGELYGRATQKFWGMYFPADLSGVLRHPSQLYEAFFEGLVIFIILWSVRNKSKFPGQLLLAYLFLYGFSRFQIEFFREPDHQIGLMFSFLTLGQIFSVALILAVMVIYFFKKYDKTSFL